MENVIIKFVADTSGLEPAIKQLELIGKISKEDAAAFSAINEEQKEFIQNLNKSTLEAGKLSKEIDNIGNTLIDESLAKATDELEKFTNETKKTTDGAKTLKAELRELKKQIASGNFSGKELEQMTKRAAELTDHLGDVNDKIKALASDTKYLDAIGGAMKGIAAAASVAAGATALFGTESEDLTRATQKAQAAMALLAGVQEVAALATTENAVKTIFLDNAQKLAAASSRVLGVTITTSMAAATMGLSLVIGALAVFASSMQESVSEVDRLNKKIETFKKTQELLSKNREEELKQIKDNKERELALNRYYYEQEKKQIAQSGADGIAIEVATMTIFKKFRNQHYEIIKKYDDLELAAKKKLEEDKIKLAKDAQEKQKKINADEEAAFKARQQKYAEMMDKMREIDDERTEDAINNRKKEQKAAEDAILAKMNAQLAANQKEIDDYWRKKQEEIDAELKAAQKKKELAQFTIDQARVVADTIFTIMQQNRQANFDADMTALEETRNRELDNKNLTESQRAQIEKRYRLEEARLKQQAWKQQKDADLAQAVINGALAISRAWTLGLPAAIPASIAAGVATAAQIAVIANTKPPKFADGTEFLIGAGTGRSDNNLAYLSHGERVVPAAVNSDYFPALSAIHNREVEPTFANNILTALANGTFDLASQYHQGQSKVKSSFDIEKLGKVLEKNKTNVNINIDENGFNKYVEKSHNRTEFRNAKLRIKV